MNSLFRSLLACVLALEVIGQAGAAPADAPFVRENLQFAATQYQHLLRELKDQPGFPRSFENGQRTFTAAHQWTSGFFPGSLWLLFEATGEPNWREAAEKYTAALDSAKHYSRTHDLGFILYCSYGNGWRLTRNPAYRAVLLEGARTLSARFNPTVGAIRSWDDSAWEFPVIIDNMMNLELLTWAAMEGKLPELRDQAMRHANTTLCDHFRPNGSSYHVVSYNPADGSVRGRQTHQGTRDDSSWARGQAWALYGFTLMFRETKRPQYLEQARAVARFLLQHPRLPADGVPYWDFDAPGIPKEPRDSSAAAIMASALLELAGYVDEAEAKTYRQLARRQLTSLSRPLYRAAVGENGGFLLQHATGNHPKKSEVDAPLVYGDYYFLEALLRLLKAGPAEAP